MNIIKNIFFGMFILGLGVIVNVIFNDAGIAVIISLSLFVIWLIYNIFFALPRYLIIPKGFHRTLPPKLVLPIKLRDEFVIKRTFRFERYQCYKKTGDPNIDNDISKLFGISLYMSSHIESYRLGMRFVNDGVEIFSYIYQNKKLLPPYKITKIPWGIAYSFEIMILDGEIILSVISYQGKTLRESRKYKYDINKKTGRTMELYIGGDCSAQRKIKILRIK